MSESPCFRPSPACGSRIQIWALILLAGILALQTSEAQAQRPRNKPAARGAAASGPQLYTSPNFRLMTDLSSEEAEELLGRLETMLKLVTAYFGRKNTKPIEMYVPLNLDAWPEQIVNEMSPEGIRSIESGGGLTITRSVRAGDRIVDAKSVVYATANHGTPQHEAVHAYCGQAFGELGPVWYAEGMAEVGNYWVEGDKSVTAQSEVLEYLRNEEPKPLKDIVDNPLEQTGDSWQNYAWRWALCHLLGFNENYTDRFKPLGMAMLNGQDVSFWTVYGDQSKEIEFEYLFFLKHLKPGFRCDLCSWDWKSRGKPLKGSSTIKTMVKAERGWQATRIHVSPDAEYEYAVGGQWKTAADLEPTDPNGGETHGKLVAIVFNDYQLSEPFELGAGGTFQPPVEGDLFLRCEDDWGELSDNEGRASAIFRLKGKADAPPLKTPELKVTFRKPPVAPTPRKPTGSTDKQPAP